MTLSLDFSMEFGSTILRLIYEQKYLLRKNWSSKMIITNRSSRKFVMFGIIDSTIHVKSV